MIDWTFLTDPAGFGLSEGWVNVTLNSNYVVIFLAGLLNTLKVAIPALFVSTLLGVFIGLGRVSHEWVIRAICNGYVSVFRNVPLLLQLLALYFLLIQFLPLGSQAWQLGDWFYLSKSGFFLPAYGASGWMLPQQGTFTVEGGWVLTPEYLAVLLALVFYTSSFIAEVTRAGVLSVPKGLQQGGFALGLTANQVKRLVTLPMALRLMVPPLSNQYINLIKNSSLGVAIGYPDLISVSNTTINQSGRAIECVILVMLIYALLSLLMSSFMNLVNTKINRGQL